MDLYEIPLDDLKPAKVSNPNTPTSPSNQSLKRYARHQRWLKYFYLHTFIAYATSMVLYITFSVIGKRQRISQSIAEESGHKLCDAFAVGVLIFPILCGISTSMSCRNIRRAADMRRRQVESGETVWKSLPNWMDGMFYDVILFKVSIAMLVVGIMVVSICETL
ncbi:hypothetical protein TWF506_008337 [Arthrobotrys conoides]|uniref:Uncharacterized protein n=1 Tax=Arthrobotrys conoides TaxID=74498 RepID=A0AAN8NIX3_9PEZI